MSALAMGYFVQNLLGAEPPQAYEIGKSNLPAP
jgi:hypothetical protein